MSEETTTVRQAPGATRFGIIDAHVIEDPTISVRAKVVYTLLAVHADKGGKGTPGRRRMATCLGVSLDTVDRALDDLRTAGVVTWTHRHGVTKTLLSSEYTLHHMGAPRAGVAAPERAPYPQESGHPSRTSAATPSRTSAAENNTNMNNTNEQVPPAAADGAAALFVVPADLEPETTADIADALTGHWWERFNPRPTTSYVGQRKIIQKLLEVGWAPSNIARVLATEDAPITAARMEQRLRGGVRPGGLVPAHDWKDGDSWSTSRR